MKGRSSPVAAASVLRILLLKPPFICLQRQFRLNIYLALERVQFSTTYATTLPYVDSTIYILEYLFFIIYFLLSTITGFHGSKLNEVDKVGFLYISQKKVSFFFKWSIYSDFYVLDLLCLPPW